MYVKMGIGYSSVKITETPKREKYLDFDEVVGHHSYYNDVIEVKKISQNLDLIYDHSDKTLRFVKKLELNKIVILYFEDGSKSITSGTQILNHLKNEIFVYSNPKTINFFMKIGIIILSKCVDLNNHYYEIKFHDSVELDSTEIPESVRQYFES